METTPDRYESPLAETGGALTTEEVRREVAKASLGGLNGVRVIGDIRDKATRDMARKIIQGES